jgi:carbohydrate-binding DOMON domain-containing protein
LIELQGFGQRYNDAHGTKLGTATIRANAISRYITFRVPKASLGTPTSSWSFTVVLTGQDGFSPDHARSFASTPQAFQFGVCAAPNPSDPHCTVNPNTVPKAMDVLTPPNVTQSDELDYTKQSPVVFQAVVIPCNRLPTPGRVTPSPEAARGEVVSPNRRSRHERGRNADCWR